MTTQVDMAGAGGPQRAKLVRQFSEFAFEVGLPAGNIRCNIATEDSVAVGDFVYVVLLDTHTWVGIPAAVFATTVTPFVCRRPR
jgi:hypothetical protein